ncbi:MAG: hypothetical protein JO126_02885 [Alphaproteobacteria bacterium]|nr:hypothetical protein [Alphaproteobacteria bacterium]MBV8548386.1 hypothetical protein [Alphaproteobacteria bacterium]
MNKLSLATAFLAAMLATTPALSNDGGTTPPMNFDTQILHVLEVSLQAQGEYAQNVTDKERAVLDRILKKFRDHKMALKNVVYRTDMGVIRITWADDKNIDVVKTAYKTSKDPILGNSAYADKDQIVDVKIMYRKTPDSYDYLRLQNMKNTMDAFIQNGYDQPIADPTWDYMVQGKLSNEKCGFCHILARNDGSPSGVFFPRYQENGGTHDIGEMGSVFHLDGFSKKSASDAEDLGLAEMNEDFLYRKIILNGPDAPEDAKRYARTIIELPELIEVMARDNKTSICVAVDFGEMKVKEGFGRNDYVCADNTAQKLSVRLTNTMLTVNHGAKEYTEPYFEKK